MKRRAWAWGPVVVWAALIFAASQLGAAQLPASQGFWRFDKLVHALVYALLAGLVYRATRKVWLAVAIAVAYGVTDELHQSLVPGRDADPWDACADGLGALAGALAVHAYCRHAARS